jgi:hypothetical protein
MALRRFCLAVGLGGLLAGAAMAADDGAPVATASASADEQIAQWMKDAPPVDASGEDDGPRGCPAHAKADRKIHGEVGAAIGSGGYRSAYGVATMPIGDSSSVTVGVATGRGRGSGWGGGGFGYGAGGHLHVAGAGHAHVHGPARDCQDEADDSAAPPPETVVDQPH